MIESGSLKSIADKLCPNANEIAKENKDYLRILFKYVLWFTTNSVATRGHDETEESEKQGNWLSFIKLQLETNPTFQELHEKVSKSRSTDYTSKTFFNGFVTVVANGVRDAIYSDIANCGMYSVLIDESKDKGKKEELALAVRYYSEKVVERFIEIKHLTEFDAQTIAAHTKDLIEFITQHSDGSVVISLGADGASVMSGEYAGVGEILRSQHFPWILYIHCTAHRLNLIVNDLVKDSPLAVDVLATITRLYSFLNIGKVRPVYQKIFQEMFPKTQTKYLTQQFEVRWSCKFEAVDFVAEKPECILATLAEVSNNGAVHGAKHAEEAAGFYHKLMSGKFIVALVTLQLFLAELDNLSKELQAVDINWTEVQYCVTRTRFGLKEITEEAIYEAAEECSKKMGIPLVLDNTIHNTRSGGFERSEEEIEAQLKNAITALNSYMQAKLEEEFKVRFDDKNVDILKACEAFDAASENFLDFEKLLYMVDHFDCLNVNRTLLKTEARKAKYEISLGLPMRRRGMENLMKLINVKNTLSTSSASVERAFSAMNRICTKLRSSLTSERLSDLMCVTLNRDIALHLDIDTLIKKWASICNRRINI